MRTSHIIPHACWRTVQCPISKTSWDSSAKKLNAKSTVMEKSLSIPFDRNDFGRHLNEGNEMILQNCQVYIPIFGISKCPCSSSSNYSNMILQCPASIENMLRPFAQYSWMLLSPYIGSRIHTCSWRIHLYLCNIKHFCSSSLHSSELEIIDYSLALPMRQFQIPFPNRYFKRTWSRIFVHIKRIIRFRICIGIFCSGYSQAKRADVTGWSLFNQMRFITWLSNHFWLRMNVSADISGCCVSRERYRWKVNLFAWLHE